MSSPSVNRGLFAAGTKPANACCFRLRVEAEAILRCLRPKGHDGAHYDAELAATWEDLQDEPAVHDA